MEDKNERDGLNATIGSTQVNEQIKNSIISLAAKYNIESIPPSQKILHLNGSITSDLVFRSFDLNNKINELTADSTKHLLFYQNGDYRSSLLITDKEVLSNLRFGTDGTITSMMLWENIKSIYVNENMVFFNDRLIFINNLYEPKNEFKESNVLIWSFIKDVIDFLSKIIHENNLVQQNNKSEFLIETISRGEFFENVNKKELIVFLISCDNNDSNHKYSTIDQLEATKELLDTYSMFLKYGGDFNEFVKVFKYHLSSNEIEFNEFSQANQGIDRPSIIFTYDGKLITEIFPGSINNRNIFNTLSIIANSEEVETEQPELAIQLFVEALKKRVKNKKLAVKVEHYGNKIWYYLAVAVTLGVLFFSAKSCH